MRFGIGSRESDALRSSTQVPLKLIEAIPDETKASKAMKVANCRPLELTPPQGVLLSAPAPLGVIFIRDCIRVGSIVLAEHN